MIREQGEETRMSWELTTHEFELREGFTEVFEIGSPSHRGRMQEENEQPALVLVEALSGGAEQIAGVIVRSDGANFASSQAQTSSTHVLTGYVKRSAGIAVQVTARLGDRFRISILRLRGKLVQAFKGAPCDLCKAIAKLIARGLLAVNGLSMAGIEASDALVDCDIQTFIEKAKQTDLWKWIENANLSVLVFAMMGPLFLFIRGIKVVEDWVYEEACRAVGACGDPPRRRFRIA